MKDVDVTVPDDYRPSGSEFMLRLSKQGIVLLRSHRRIRARITVRVADPGTTFFDLYGPVRRSGIVTLRR